MSDQFKYAMNQEVNFNNFQLSGVGIVKGYARVTPPEVILEVQAGSDVEFPQHYYPFNHIVIPEADII